jgi:hypothetical protein
MLLLLDGDDVLIDVLLHGRNDITQTIFDAALTVHKSMYYRL